MRSNGSGPSWTLEIDAPKNKVKTFYQETVDVVKYIYENKQGHMYLLYSGGMDSEFVFSLFLDLGFDFTPVIIRLNPEYNEHDLKHAFDFCKNKNIKPLVIDIDFDDFVTSGKILEIAESIECASYQLPATLYAASQLDGFVIMGDAPPSLTLDNGRWQVVELQSIHSILKYFTMNNLKGCPFILTYTAEQYLAFLSDPVTVALTSNQFPGKLGNNSTKVHIYNNESRFNIKNRTKYTGYEIIKRSDIFQHKNIQTIETLKNYWAGQYYEDYNLLIERLRCNQ